MIYLPPQAEIVRYAIELRRTVENFGLDVKDITIKFCDGELIYVIELEKGTNMRYLPVLKNTFFTVESD